MCNFIWIPIFVRNRVELFGDYFIFYYGFSKNQIYIKDITKIEKSRSLIASSANALDRIHITTNEKEFYVSLKNNQTFINEINQIKNS